MVVGLSSGDADSGAVPSAAAVVEAAISAQVVGDKADGITGVVAAVAAVVGSAGGTMTSRSAIVTAQ